VSARRSLTPASAAGTVVLASIVAKSMAERLAEHDLWWHLRTGQLIVATHRIPTRDPFSFTVPGRAWIVQEWLSEVFLHGVRVVGGLRGIIVWRSLMLLLIYALAARLILRASGGIRGWVIVALAAYAGAPGWIERPNLFSTLMFVVLLTLLERGGRAWWAIPIVMALWANLHAMVLIGIGTMLVYAVTQSIAGRGARAGAALGTLWGVTGLSIVASFANPHGPRLFVYAAGLIRTVASSAAEWQSPDFHQGLHAVFLVLVLVTLGLLALSPKRPAVTDVTLACAFVALGLYAERNLPLAGIMLGVVCARVVPDATKTSGAPSGTLLPAIALIAGLAAAAVLPLKDFPRSGSLADVADPSFPVAAIDALPHRPVRLFAEDRWAALALYMRWPQVRVAFDGRGDLYGSAIIRRYSDTIAGNERWLDEICATHALVSESSPLAAVLHDDARWTLLTSERLPAERASLFERRTAATCA
jgi:hypothetical protein